MIKILALVITIIGIIGLVLGVPGIFGTNLVAISPWGLAVLGIIFFFGGLGMLKRFADKNE